MVPRFIPTLLKHCTMAIYDKGGKANNENWFEQSFMIARAQLARQGYLTDTSVSGATSSIRLTAKGVARNTRHAGEQSGSNARFNRLYEQFVQQEIEKMPQSRTEAPDRAKQERIADLRLADIARTAISARDRQQGEPASPVNYTPVKVTRQKRPTQAPGRAATVPRGRAR